MPRSLLNAFCRSLQTKLRNAIFRPSRVQLAGRSSSTSARAFVVDFCKNENQVIIVNPFSMYTGRSYEAINISLSYSRVCVEYLRAIYKSNRTTSIICIREGTTMENRGLRCRKAKWTCYNIALFSRIFNTSRTYPSWLWFACWLETVQLYEILDHSHYGHYRTRSLAQGPYNPYYMAHAIFGSSSPIIMAIRDDGARIEPRICAIQTYAKCGGQQVAFYHVDI